MAQETDLAAVVTGAAQDIGSFIRSQREAAEVSVRQLAERAGVSNPYLSQIERGLAIIGDAAITERQKRVLLDIYLSFLQQNESGRKELP
ncbi:MAG: helix-turn-helix transcriptional regulator [Mycobacterium sp.]|nr:helix-turn-helix transcriptional regulator [Mycobacterium sp.]